MADESTGIERLSFKLNPAGKDLSVLLKCKGIATGTYMIQFHAPGQLDQVRTGNIESPERHQFPAGGALTRVTVKVSSVPFLASDPGGYHLIIEQPGGERIETPMMPYSALVEVRITDPSGKPLAEDAPKSDAPATPGTQT